MILVAILPQAGQIDMSSDQNPSWREQCEKEWEQERACRARLPDLLQAGSFAKSVWKERCQQAGLHPGFVTVLDSTRIDPLRFYLPGHEATIPELLQLDAERHGRSHRLAGITIKVGQQVLAALRIEDDALLFSGSWGRCSAGMWEKLNPLLEAVIGQPPRAAPPADLELEASIRDLPGKWLRCSACRKRIVRGPFLGLHHGSAATGQLHLDCASSEARQLLGQALACVPHVERRSALAPYLSAGARLEKGPLVRCTACRKAISKGTLRLLDGDQVLHEACAQASCPDALESARAALRK
jgi:hypothetical protein